MTALLAFVLGNPTFIAICGGIVAALGWGIRQRLAGADANEATHTAEEATARDVAGQIDNDVGALPADTARKELKSWARD